MNTMMNFKKTTRLLVALTALLVAGCSSPFQGSGAMYIADKGIIRCVNVDSVTFWSSRHTTYESEGKDYSTQGALEYSPNVECN